MKGSGANISTCSLCLPSNTVLKLKLCMQQGTALEHLGFPKMDASQVVLLVDIGHSYTKKLIIITLPNFTAELLISKHLILGHLINSSFTLTIINVNMGGHLILND